MPSLISLRPLFALPLGLLLVSLAACGDKTAPAATPQSPAATQDASWPRTIATPRGELKLEKPPRRIVSTSITLTGTLLAINAPIIGTGATMGDTEVSDAQGFFKQWADVARARGVQPIYHGEPDSEAIAAAEPDLIVMTSIGGDSAIRIYEQLSEVAPVLVLDYDDKTWQELATILGRATGRETDAAQVIQRFDAEVAAVRQTLRLPPQPVTALVYYADGSGANVWTPESAHGRLLTQLGFQLAPVPDSVKGDHSMGLRKDVIQVSGEKFADGLSGQTLLLFSADERTIAQMRANRFLARHPAIVTDRIYATGLDTFRLDYYSASALLKRLHERFR